MDRLTLNSIRPQIAAVLGLCSTSTDARITSLINRAQERLMRKGKWVGTVQSYRVCTSQSCITWPRQIETIEAIHLCDSPLTIRDRWYEFTDNGPGRQSQDTGSLQLLPRDSVCCFAQVDGLTSRINVVSDVPEAADARILLQYYDANSNWVRTQEPALSGTYIDGEFVNITTGGARTTFNVMPGSGLVRIIKPITKGPVRLFEWPTVLQANFKELAYYESDETIPIYRSSLIPNLANASACAGAQDACTDKTVTIQAKLRHIPVTNGNDFLILGNAAAFELGARAILKEERNLYAEAKEMWALAIMELEAELTSFEGHGVVPTIRVQGSSIFGGAVQNAVDPMFGISTFGYTRP